MECLRFIVEGGDHLPFPPVQRMDRMIGDTDHVEVVTAPDAGHVVLRGEKVIIEPRQDFRQLQFDGKSALPSLSADQDVEFHASPSWCEPKMFIPFIF